MRSSSGIHIFSVTGFAIGVPLVAFALCWAIWSRVTITSTIRGEPVVGAKVVVNGQEICQTPCAKKLPPAPYRIEVFAPAEKFLASQKREWEFTLYAGRYNLNAEFPVAREQ